MLKTRNPKICETHARHATYQGALAEVCRLFGLHKIRVVVFPSSRISPCQCGGWHVGHLRRFTKDVENAKRKAKMV